jgi:DNA polymerase-3 subunit delta
MKLSYYKLREHLDKGKLQPVYVISGTQDLLRELAVDTLAESALGGEKTPFNYERFDGEEADGAHVAMAANLLPMLGGCRVVCVKRAQKLLEKSEELQAYIGDPSPSTVLVLELSKTPDKRRKAWKQVEKTTTVVSCDAPKSVELEEWVSEQAFQRELPLDRDAVRYLVAEFGTDLRRLLTELEKLSLFSLSLPSGGNKMDLETIATVLGRGKAQSIFKFVDAVGAGNSSQALLQLGRLLEEGEPPLKILALVDRLLGQLRVARELQDASSGGRGGANLARVLGVPPYAVKSLSEAARRFDRRDLANALRTLAETDRILKSSALPARLVLESLTIALCAPGRSVSSPPLRRPGG